MSRKPDRLNHDLDPQKFEVLVSWRHGLVLNDFPGADGQGEGSRLFAYLEDLGVKPSTEDPGKLMGLAAVEHARRVHAKIRRHFLRFDNVTAVDVGFAVRRGKFENTLAIRIHVRAKHSMAYLERTGYPDFTNARQFVKALYGRSPAYAEGVLADDLGLDQQSKEDAIRNQVAKLLSSEKKGTPRGANATDPPVPVNHCVCCGCQCDCLCPKCRGCHICCDCERCAPACDLCSPKTRLTLCGVPLDIVEAHYFPSMHHPGGDFGEGVFVDPLKSSAGMQDEELLLTGRGKVSPLVGGVSVGGPHGQAGTLGAVVWDETDGSPCILGNWHVLAGSTSAEKGQPCFQPALYDGGCADDVIAHLKRWHFGELGDAAIAQLDGSRNFACGEILGMWHPLSGYQRPELNLEIRKWGRSTGFTRGFIDGIHLATNLDFGGGLIRHLEDQFHIAPLFAGESVSQVGDSGSLVVAKHDLDDLEVIAQALLRQDAPTGTELLADALKKRGDGNMNVEALAKAFRELLEAKPAGSPSGRQNAPPHPATLELTSRVFGRRQVGPEQILTDFKKLLSTFLEECGVDLHESILDKLDKKNRQARNVYYAVGMIFAGDTPGSPFGEFALASAIEPLARELRFSLRPVFESRSSFRKLREAPPNNGGRPRRRGFLHEPGAPGSDPRGGGPQPDGATLQSGGGNTGNG